MRERKRLEGLLAMENELVRRSGDIDAYFELAREGESIEPELEREIKSLSEFVEQLEARTMLSEETDPLNAIVTVHPGAGGTESQDWADMLLRMYLRWAERHGFKTEMNDYQDGEEAGIKSATFTVTGEFAFGQLAGETGVHRLVRISPFDQAIPRLPASLFLQRSTIPFTSISNPTNCALTPIAPAARAASTSTRRTPRSVSPTCPPILWCSVRTSVRSTRIARRR
jgi:hypothetical protein